MISLYSNVLPGRSTAAGGVLATMIAVGSAVGNLIAGLYIRRFGRLKTLTTVSTVIFFGVVLIVQNRWQGAESVAEAGVEIFVCGVCNGVVIGTLLVGLLKSVNDARKSSVFISVQSLMLNLGKDKAAIYGAHHLCTAVAYLVALAIITAVIQSRVRLYMRDVSKEHGAEDLLPVNTSRGLKKLSPF